MKRNLWIATLLVAVAGIGFGLVVVLPFWNRQDDLKKTIKPRTEPILALPKVEKATPALAKNHPVQVAINQKKPVEVTPPVVKKTRPEPHEKDKPAIPAKKDDAPPIAKKVEPAKKDTKPDYSKVLPFGNTIRLRDPEGEFTVKPLTDGVTMILVGEIKTLKVASVNAKSTLDTTGLDAGTIVFLGSINAGSMVRLGKAKKLKVQSVDGGSTFDASASAADEISFSGNINGGSHVMASAPGGKILLGGEINGGARVDIKAPGARFRLKSNHATIINGESTLTVLAKDIELLGAIDGTRTEVQATLSRGGSLKFLQINGGARLHYRKAAAVDPRPRIEAGRVAPRAQFKEVPARR